MSTPSRDWRAAAYTRVDAALNLPLLVLSIAAGVPFTAFIIVTSLSDTDLQSQTDAVNGMVDSMIG